MKIIRIFLFAILFAFFSGCAAHGGYRNRGVLIHTAPPAKRVIVKSSSPYKNGVWVAGYWNWTGHKYTWVSGKWQKPRNGQVWVDGYWKNSSRGYVRVKGHWRKR